MNGLLPLDSLKRALQVKIADVRAQRFFRDRLSVLLLVCALIVNGANLITLVLNLTPSDGQVPVRFSNLTLFDALGPWYFPVLIALFALAVTLVNGWFAYYSFNRSRLASFFLLVGSAVVAVFAFIISLAFGGVQ